MHQLPAHALLRVLIAPSSALFLTRLESVGNEVPQNLDKFKFGQIWMVSVEEVLLIVLLLIDNFVNHILWIIV